MTQAVMLLPVIDLATQNSAEQAKAKWQAFDEFATQAEAKCLELIQAHEHKQQNNQPTQDDETY